MSTTAVQEFLTKLGEDQTLQAELNQAMEAENDREAVTTLAKSKGYDFSTDELWTEIQARQAEMAKRQEAGELSDEELEAVAGGELIVAGFITLGATTVGAIGGTVSYLTTKW
ncbi:MAG: Nif11-like leader peptide family natural product precursor [Leptolyngbya sp. SIO1E4]|nr:Nif11-like leader peptide family natural product precursor [Leptolyngbya sp. SIO1E4]